MVAILEGEPAAHFLEGSSENETQTCESPAGQGRACMPLLPEFPRAGVCHSQIPNSKHLLSTMNQHFAYIPSSTLILPCDMVTLSLLQRGGTRLGDVQYMLRSTQLASQGEDASPVV